MNNHLAKNTLKLMTVKDLSSVLNVSDRTIQRHLKKIRSNSDNVVDHGKTTYITEPEATEIKLLIEHSGRRDIEGIKDLPKTNLEKTLLIKQGYDLLLESITSLQSENESLKIELDKSTQYHSVKKVKMMGFIPNISARKAWSPLKKWSIENDYKIISIFDANYGNVKTYHADAWKAVYGVML
jgi:predicted transcriptional regulator